MGVKFSWILWQFHIIQYYSFILLILNFHVHRAITGTMQNFIYVDKKYIVKSVSKNFIL